MKSELQIKDQIGSLSGCKRRTFDVNMEFGVFSTVRNDLNYDDGVKIISIAENRAREVCISSINTENVRM